MALSPTSRARILQMAHVAARAARAARAMVVAEFIGGLFVMVGVFGGLAEFVDAVSSPPSLAQERWILAPAQKSAGASAGALQIRADRPLSDEEQKKFMAAIEASPSRPVEIVADGPLAAKAWTLTQAGLGTPASRLAQERPELALDLGLAGAWAARRHGDYGKTGAVEEIQRMLARRNREGLDSVDAPLTAQSQIHWGWGAARVGLLAMLGAMLARNVFVQRANAVWDGFFGFARRGFILARAGAPKAAGAWGLRLAGMALAFCAAGAFAALGGRLAADLLPQSDWLDGAKTEFVHEPRDPAARASDWALGPLPEQAAALRRQNPLGSDGDLLWFRADEPWPLLARQLREGIPASAPGTLWKKTVSASGAAAGGPGIEFWAPASALETQLPGLLLDPWVLRLRAQTLSPRAQAQAARLNGMAGALRLWLEAGAAAGAIGWLWSRVELRRKRLASQGKAESLFGAPEWESRELARARAASEAAVLRKELALAQNAASASAGEATAEGINANAKIARANAEGSNGASRDNPNGSAAPAPSARRSTRRL